MKEPSHRNDAITIGSDGAVWVLDMTQTAVVCTWGEMAREAAAEDLGVRAMVDLGWAVEEAGMVMRNLFPAAHRSSTE